MNELQKIVDAYALVRARGARAALATVVGVEGSAYRRPGARAIFTEDGETVGAISGGCLERDVAERAERVIESRDTMMIEYDTRGDEDIVWGLGLGCNGVVRVLLESLHEGGDGARALEFVGELLRARKYGVMATVVARDVNQSGGATQNMKVGARLLLDEKLNVCGGAIADAAPALAARIGADAVDALACRRALTCSYETNSGRVEIFYDVVAPPRPLVVFGAGHDALPLVRQAHTLGWHVTVVDTRARALTKERFTEADEVVLCRAEDVDGRVSLTENTAAVVMTHNYLDDVELLKTLLPSPVCYLGVLGPRARTSKLLAEIGACAAAEPARARLHSPIGLDIGAETPEEIALSIVAEVGAVCAARGGGFLRDRAAPIHGESEAGSTATPVANALRVRFGAGESALACRSS
jgi:xanthine/CO dehydrogenase XdhC/CoxF family maturation factor